MKKLHLTIIAIIVAINFSYAQWITSGNNIYNNNTGNIGVGTATPGNLLTISGTGTVLNVYGNGKFNNALSVYGSFTRSGNFQGTLVGSFGVGLSLLQATSTDLSSASSSVISANAYAGIGVLTFAAANTGVTYTNGYALYVDGAPVGGTNVTITNPYALYINSGVSYLGGNVLIGTPPQPSTGYKLNVAGSVRANAVTVNTSGADFVFAPSYRLNSLEKLKKFIDKNHHLPEISSAKEMQANGLNVGDTETKLLQKVEELTLYLIQKDKQLNDQNNKLMDQETQLLDQQKTNQTQQQDIDQLKKQVSELLKRSK